MAVFINVEEARNILEYISWKTNAVHPVWLVTEYNQNVA